MFTGIIERRGRVESVAPSAGGGVRLRLEAGAMAVESPCGASVAVGGVCLTVAGGDATHLEFDVVPETLRRTTLGGLRRGDEVNLERSLRVGDRLDGHFVQGHVDGTALVSRVLDDASGYTVWLRVQDGLRRCMIPKGSVAVDGVSLTVADVAGDEFAVALIPTTLAVTTLGALRPGDRVNIETDILVRTLLASLARFMPGAVETPDGVRFSSITLERLQEAGFA